MPDRNEAGYGRNTILWIRLDVGHLHGSIWNFDFALAYGLGQNSQGDLKTLSDHGQPRFRLGGPSAGFTKVATKLIFEDFEG